MSNSDLTTDRLREVLAYEPETGVFKMLVSTAQRVRPGTTISVKMGQYGRVQIDGTRYKLHRLAFLYMTGEWPKYSVDHINGEPSDNRFANLRDVPHATNVQNKRKAFSNSKSHMLGVYQAKRTGRWLASIRHNGSTIHVGSFATPEEAHAAYLKKKRQLHSGCTI